jgi:hypothetical protein
MFERFVLCEQEALEIGRRYIQAFGMPKAPAALLDDMNAGRLPWGKARAVIGHMPYLVVESIARRVGFTRFRDVCLDPEFIGLQGNSVARMLQRHVGFPEPGPARAVEDFAWHFMRHWHLVAHDLAGRHTYEVAPALAHRLRQPEVLDQPWSRPCVPAASVLLVVPPEAQLTLAQWGGAPRVVTELYVVESAPPQHQWAVWIHAPVDNDFAEGLYVELPFGPEASLEDGLERAQDLFQSAAPTAHGWKDCVRWLAAAMRYLAESGSRADSLLAPRAQLPEVNLERRILTGAVDLLH